MADVTEPAPAVPSLPPAPEPATVRKRRGRPPGSKNKPKPPVVVTRESAAAMRPAVLELASGSDVVAAVSAFARRRGVGVSVLCGRGAVAAVTLRLAASPSAAAAVTLHGRFEVLSLAGTVLPSAPPAPFAVALAGAGGQVIGGTLAGEMTAAADGVVLVAATFGSAEVHRLPVVEEDEEGVGVAGGGREEGRRQHQQQVAVEVGLAGGYGGPAVGLGGGGGGHVDARQHGAQVALHEMALWAQPTSSRGPVHALPHF